MLLRRTLRWLLLAWLLLAASVHAQPLAPIPPLTGPVIDTTGTLDAATRQQLEAQARALQQRKGSQLQVLVEPSTQPEDIAQYAVRAYQQYRLGRAALSGTRISGRVQCSSGNSSLRVTAHLFGGDLWAPGGLARVETCGAVTADSGGTGIDPGGSANTKGAYSSALIASTSFDYKSFFVCIGGNKNSVVAALTRARLDIAIGAASSEQVILPDYQIVCGTAGDAYMPGVSPFLPIPIPAGSRISARAQSSNTDATDRLFDVVVYGVG